MRLINGVLYAHCYCEENIWHLGGNPALATLLKKAVFISNGSRKCAFFHQRASHSPEVPTIWDYHVILIGHDSGWKVWDLDSSLPFPVGLMTYVSSTFIKEGATTEDLIPYFRVVDFEEFRDNFSSDRSHMRDSSGEWIAQPPAWPAILRGETSNLFDFVDMGRKFLGSVMNLHDFRAHYG